MRRLLAIGLIFSFLMQLSVSSASEDFNTGNKFFRSDFLSREERKEIIHSINENIKLANNNKRKFHLNLLKESQANHLGENLNDLRRKILETNESDLPEYHFVDNRLITVIPIKNEDKVFIFSLDGINVTTGQFFYTSGYVKKSLLESKENKTAFLTNFVVNDTFAAERGLGWFGGGLSSAWKGLKGSVGKMLGAGTFAGALVAPALVTGLQLAGIGAAVTLAGVGGFAALGILGVGIIGSGIYTGYKIYQQSRKNRVLLKVLGSVYNDCKENLKEISQVGGEYDNYVKKTYMISSLENLRKDNNPCLKDPCEKDLRPIYNAVKYSQIYTPVNRAEFKRYARINNSDLRKGFRRLKVKNIDELLSLGHDNEQNEGASYPISEMDGCISRMLNKYTVNAEKAKSYCEQFRDIEECRGNIDTILSKISNGKNDYSSNFNSIIERKKSKK